MEEDLRKMRDVSRRYYGVLRKYFCYFSDDIYTEEECRELLEKIDKDGIDTYRICFGTYDGKKWGILYF